MQPKSARELFFYSLATVAVLAIVVILRAWLDSLGEDSSSSPLIVPSPNVVPDSVPEHEPANEGPKKTDPPAPPLPEALALKSVTPNEAATLAEGEEYVFSLEFDARVISCSLDGVETTIKGRLASAKLRAPSAVKVWPVVWRAQGDGGITEETLRYSIGRPTPVVEGAKLEVLLNSFWRGSCGTAPDTYSVTLRARVASSGDSTPWRSSSANGRSWAGDFHGDRFITPRDGNAPFSLRLDPSALPNEAALEIELICKQNGPQGERQAIDSVRLSRADLERIVASSHCNRSKYSVAHLIEKDFKLTGASPYCDFYAAIAVSVDGDCRVQ